MGSNRSWLPHSAALSPQANLNAPAPSRLALRLCQQLRP